jgi:hypothetical protein
MFDLLSGVFGGADHARRLHRFPLTEQTRTEQTATEQTATVVDPRRAWAVPEAPGLTPAMLARSHWLVAFVDLVADVRTFGNIYHTLREWSPTSASRGR